MNKGAVIFLVAVVLTTLLVTIYTNSGRDVSWIPIVEEYVKEENWLPNQEYVPIAFESFFLYENGEEHFFRLDSHKDFVSYIKDLLISADRKLDCSISRDDLDVMKAEDKLLCFDLRFPVSYGLLRDFDKAYFVLDDVLGEGLRGTVLVRVFDSSRLDWWFDIWEITDLSVYSRVLSFQDSISKI